ncbi:unnamed protein product, partial [Closterium sp. NIES-54]
MKHIALCYFLAQELKHRGQLRLTYVASRANTADIFTKALGSGDHQRFRIALGLVPTLHHLLCIVIAIITLHINYPCGRLLVLGLRGDLEIHYELCFVASLNWSSVDRTSLREVETRLTLDIHPSRSGNVVAGVKEQLNNSLMRYSEQHGGIVLAYSNVLLFGRTAAILTGLNPYLHVSLSARLLLFAPRPGAFLEGVVNNVGADFIGLLVLGVFNAAVPDQFMRSWKHVEEVGAVHACLGV